MRVFNIIHVYFVFFNSYLSYIAIFVLFSWQNHEKNAFNYKTSFYYVFLIHVRIRTEDKK